MAKDAIDLLVEQHRSMEAALKKAMDASGDEQRARFAEAADLLMSHIMIEEQHFYPAVKAAKTEDILLESLEEHLSLKRVIADLVALPKGDEHFEPKLHVLKEQAEHHHEEEEEHLFPKVKKLLDEAQLVSLGKQMQGAQSKMLKGEPRTEASSQTGGAAELP